MNANLLPLIKMLKEKAFAAIAFKLFGSNGVVGIRSFIVKMIVKFGFNYIAKPIAQEVLRQGFYQYDRLNGTFLIKKKEKAKNDKNQNNYDKSVDDIVG